MPVPERAMVPAVSAKVARTLRRLGRMAAIRGFRRR
jgi:hypothetical protein